MYVAGVQVSDQIIDVMEVSDTYIRVQFTFERLSKIRNTGLLMFVKSICRQPYFDFVDVQI